MAAGRVLRLVKGMKAEQKQESKFRDLITEAYQLWGTGQTEKMMRLAINARLMVVQGPPQVLISSGGEDFYEQNRQCG